MEFSQALSAFFDMPEGIDRRVICPACAPTRKKKNERTLSIKRDGTNIIYHCWHCEQRGKIAGGEMQPRFATKPIERQPDILPLSPEAIAWLKERKISAKTAERVGVFSTKFYSRQAGRLVNAIGFPYRNNGQIYASKIRSIEGKDFIQVGACQTFWNADLLEDLDQLIIVEGELDALALEEVGYKNVVSVPNGAVSRPLVDDGEDDRKFRYIWNAREVLDNVERVVIACDSDRPGQLLAEEIGRRIGKHKCWTVDFGSAKDANGLLIGSGSEAVCGAIAGAKPFPVSGVYEAESFHESVIDLYKNGAGTGRTTGLLDVDEYFTVLPGTLTVVTGVPSSGKSEFLDQVAVNLAEREDWTCAFASFENEPRFHIAKLIQKVTGQHFFVGPSERVSLECAKTTMKWINSHFVFLYQADGSLATMDDIIERLTAAVMRYGIRMAVIDPMNYIERGTANQNETQWVSDVLTKLRVFAQSYDVAVFLVAHPRMMMREGGKLPVPTGYDISGSANYVNKADFGLTIHRDFQNDPTTVQIINWKSRFSWAGKMGRVSVHWNPRTTRYECMSDPGADSDWV